jgi:hypothetical protein
MQGCKWQTQKVNNRLNSLHAEKFENTKLRKKIGDNQGQTISFAPHFILNNRFSAD